MTTETIGYKERPILFNAEMVRAVLDGRKTQTRRVIKIPSRSILDCKGLDYMLVDDHSPMTGEVGWFGWVKETGIEPVKLKCPYGVPGDRLWVRETHAFHDAWDDWTAERLKACGHNGVITYSADGESLSLKTGKPAPNTSGRWRPSIHMPRWASRILLEITNVRVERVQDITEDDAFQEGVSMDSLIYEGLTRNTVYELGRGTHKCQFANLWNSINDKRGFGWDVNPWVWVVEFKVVK